MAPTVEVRVPDIGDFHEVPVIEVPVALGDLVEAGDTIAVLESDKATLDVPAPVAGRISGLEVAIGQTVSEGSLLLRLATEPPAPEARHQPPVAEPPPPIEAGAPEPPAAPPTPTGGRTVHASPAIRGYARRLGVALDRISGSGPHGRITREDVEASVKARLAQPIAQSSGPASAGKPSLINHVSRFDRADITELDAFRRQCNAAAGPSDAELTILAFALKAAVPALKAFPLRHAVRDGDQRVVNGCEPIGVAVNTPRGLLVPVISDADRKGLRELAGELAGLAARARDGQLAATEMPPASLIVSSPDAVGGSHLSPASDATEVALLGLGDAEIRPLWDGAAFQPRLILPLSLSWHHQAVDGVAAVRFLGHIAATLSDFRRAAH